MRDYTADDLLEAREKRAELIADQVKHRHAPLVVLRANYPGLKKTNSVTIDLIREMSALLITRLGETVRAKSVLLGAEGPIFWVAVQEEALVLKQLTLELEEQHPLGRCVDLDVYDLSGRSLSRRELGYLPRKCYLCEDEAHHCVRARRHSEQEILEYIAKKYRDYRGLSGTEAWQ